MIIDNFTKADGGTFRGVIRTLTVYREDVTFTATADKKGVGPCDLLTNERTGEVITSG